MTPQRYTKSPAQRRRSAATTPKRATRRAIGYVRISVKRDGKVSPEAQVSAIEAGCRQHGLDLIDVEHDLGKSAATGKHRPALERALARIAAGEADVIVVYKLDRLTRSVLDFQTIWQRLEASGAGFVSTTEAFDTETPMGRAMLNIALAFAQLERETIQQRAIATAEYRREQQMMPGGHVPYGYRRVEATETKRAHFAIEPTQAAIVNELIDRLMAGESLRSVTRWLNESGAPLPNNCPSGSWRYGTVRKLFLSPTIAGLRDDPETDELITGGWPAIVSVERWQALRSLFDTKGASEIKGSKPVHLLSGVMRCAKCGTRLRSDGGGKRVRRYLCKSGGNVEACGGVAVGADDADAFVTAKLFERVGDRVHIEPIRVHESGELGDLEAELAELSRLYEARRISLSEWTSFRASVSAEIERVSALEAAGARQSALVALVGDGSSLEAVWGELPIDTQRAVIAEVFPELTAKSIGKGNRGGAAERIQLDAVASS